VGFQGRRGDFWEKPRPFNGESRKGDARDLSVGKSFFGGTTSKNAKKGTVVAEWGRGNNRGGKKKVGAPRFRLPKGPYKNGVQTA